MKQEQLKIALLAYNPTEQETEFKKIILDFLSTSENVFERSHCCGHITASCWLLNKARTHALMMHHKKLDQWFQLGGHCDGDTDTLAVAIKEAQEESGINDIIPLSSDIFDIDIHWIPSNKKEAGHYHYDIRYLLAVNSDEQIIQNAESNELRWIPMNGTLPTNNQSVKRMFDKCRELLAFNIASPFKQVSNQQL
ncbi:MAG TPA: NUDIX hydrolase [Candidatus Babeliales bacterium]|nr:NUDIX hydrolase [Candidatus Babeliales bacterium]